MAYDQSVGWTPLMTTLVILVVSASAYFLMRLRQERGFFAKLRKQGLPMPEHSFTTGHLLALPPAMKLLPKDAHKVYMFGNISRKFKDRGAYYLDLWPVSRPFLIVVNPELATQACQSTSIAYDKPVELREWFQPLAGGPSVFDSPKESWKPQRALFNPAFGAAHLLRMVPLMMDDILIYCDILRGHARSNEIVLLDTITLRFVMDLMGKVILNAQLNAQKGYNVLADAMLNQVAWKMSNRETNPLEWVNVPRWIIEWRNSRIMNNYIEKELGKRFKDYQAQRSEKGGPEARSIIELTLQDYLSNPSRAGATRLDRDFVTFAQRNIRMFLFAGHDSTSSTICYCYHLLWKNQSVLARVREEMDSVLGKDLTSTAAIVSEQPHLLNQLPYTHAVIKEVSRLFPPAQSLRQGAPGVDLVDENGNVYPTEKMMVWVLHHEMQRSPQYWVRPLELLPERWLVGPEDPLYPRKGAWRTFEFGPRNCIGQGLVFVEIKAILALTIREFDIRPAYDEWYEKHPKAEVAEIDGEGVYQIEEGAAHPVDKYPCRISVRH